MKPPDAFVELEKILGQTEETSRGAKMSNHCLDEVEGEEEEEMSCCGWGVEVIRGMGWWSRRRRWYLLQYLSQLSTLATGNRLFVVHCQQ